MNKRKIEVVQHALVLFQEKGIMQTSIQDIIERSGISKGTFYNYFTSKNECVYAAIEHVGYEASLIRSEIQLGKANNDISVLIEQLVKISHMNQLYGLPAILEEMIYSNDKELKGYVSLYRMHNLAWFSKRIVDIYGEKVRSYSFEVAVLFYGMLHHIKFIKRAVKPHLPEDETERIITSLVTYLEPIIDGLVHKQTATLDPQVIEQMLAPQKQQQLNLSDVLKLIDSFKQQARLTKYQAEIIDGIIEELQREELRVAILTALLPAFVNIFKNTELYDDACQIHTQIWVYMNQK